MQRSVLFTVALAVSAATATAADLYTPPPAEPGVTYAPAPFDWTGIYAGFHGGFGGDRFDYPFFIEEDAFFGFNDEDITGQFDLTSSGFFAGGQIGANWQFSPQMVVGIEADASWSDIQGELGIDVDPCCGGGFDGIDIEAGSKVNWFGTIRGRLGFLPTPRLMVYGTGGVAYGETESYANGSGEIDFDVSTSDTAWGWAAGAGFEYAVTNNITLKTEYLYVDLGSQELLNFGPDLATLDVDTHFHTIKAGLNFLYGQPGGAGADLAFDTPTTSGPFNWTGVYLGAHGGFGGDRFDYPFFLAEDAIFNNFPPDDVTGQFDVTSSGFFGGGQVGANWQVNDMFVVGAVADIAASDIKGELGLEIDGFLEGEAGSKVNWFGTARGRIGFLPTQRLMIYGTGGFAYGEVESFLSGSLDSGGSLDLSTADTQTGWTAGGGFEYAVTDRVTLFTEYLFVDLGDQNLLNGGDFGGDPSAFSLDAETQFHTIKAGINVLFN